MASFLHIRRCVGLRGLLFPKVKLEGLLKYAIVFFEQDPEYYSSGLITGQHIKAKCLRVDSMLGSVHSKRWNWVEISKENISNHTRVRFTDTFEVNETNNCSSTSSRLGCMLV